VQDCCLSGHLELTVDELLIVRTPRSLFWRIGVTINAWCRMNLVRRVLECGRGGGASMRYCLFDVVPDPEPFGLATRHVDTH
jgi:hypothetical protein